MTAARLHAQFTVRRQFWLRLVVYLVGLHGLYVIATTLLEQFRAHPGMRLTGIDIDIPLLIGFGLVYLATLLRRRKRTAWFVAVLAYIFMLGFYAQQVEGAIDHRDYPQVISKLGLPLLCIGLLALYRRSFTVRSDIRSFRYALAFVALIMLTAFAYGTAGFLLLDDHDFHHEFSVGEAMHHTVDQFGLTDNTLRPATRRARLFVDSLSVVSVAAVTVAAVSLFQPIRARYGQKHDGHVTAATLLAQYGGSSEDFFKLWPHDKAYYFDTTRRCGVAYRSQGGVALVIGDPMGERRLAKTMLRGFEDLCYGNDWQPAFIHAQTTWSEFYEKHGYRLQKLGEEAVVGLEHFRSVVAKQKRFREIRNKFQRLGYTAEILSPPHTSEVLKELRAVSDDWLIRPGRAERGFVMGYFSVEYLQQCPLLVARDAAGIIQAFLNRIPSFDPAEATFDLLRQAASSPGNVNDYLLLSFIDQLAAEPEIKRLNLGLCPLAGMDDTDDASVVTRLLRFMYANGDRFYSFSGLRRFKAKYQPEWRARNVAYKGNLADFARGTNALARAMRVSKKSLGR